MPKPYYLRCLMLMSLLVLGCQNKKQPLLGDTPFQRKMNAEFKDASKSPLTSKDLKEFKSLDFFEYDERFKVNAVLERIPDAEWFQMPTTTERMSKERIFAIARFNLLGEDYELHIYQGEENMNTEGLEDYLFLPFLDLTNGEGSYSGGRYINLRIPEGNSIEIDFNSAYNPFCVYNEKFSCPIVPRVNFLDVHVTAGVKMYKKDR